MHPILSRLDHVSEAHVKRFWEGLFRRWTASHVGPNPCLALLEFFAFGTSACVLTDQNLAHGGLYC